MHTSSSFKTDLNVCSDAHTLELVEQGLSQGFLLSKIDRKPLRSTSELGYKTKTHCQASSKSEISAESLVATNV